MLRTQIRPLLYLTTQEVSWPRVVTFWSSAIKFYCLLNLRQGVGVETALHVIQSTAENERGIQQSNHILTLII